MENRRLYKINNGKKLFGVCGGLAEYLNVDPSIVRLLWVMFGLFYATGIIAYIAAALILPYKEEIM